MIELVIDYLNTKIKSDLGYYKNTFGLCEIINKEESEFPAFYDKGEYKKVIDFDKQFSTLYYRINGAIQTTTIEDELPVYLQQKNYPIRLVSVVRKNILKNCNNNEYIDDLISNNISNVIVGSYNQFARDNKLESLYVNTSSISLDRKSILSNELKIKELKFPYEWSIITLDINIIISQYKECTTNISC